MRAFFLVMDDCAHRHMGTNIKIGGQCIEVGSTNYPKHFDGWKCYFQIQKPTSADMANYLILELTSSTTYEPQRRYSHRVHQTNTAVEQWRARLRFPTIETTKATLAHNVNMVQTLQAETRKCTRHHYKTRVWTLRLHKIDDVVYSDTFFSDITSIRGFKCFNYLLTSIQHLKG